LDSSPPFDRLVDQAEAETARLK